MALNQEQHSTIPSNDSGRHALQRNKTLLIRKAQYICDTEKKASFHFIHVVDWTTTMQKRKTYPRRPVFEKEQTSFLESLYL